MSIDRRELFVGGVAGLMAACSKGSAGEPEQVVIASPPADPALVRVASVKTAVEGSLLPKLAAMFEQTSSYRVHVETGVQVYDLARAGKADVVVSHYGHKDAEQFVLDGLGEFPRTICSNQMALIGPKTDPAGVRGLADMGEAIRRIAAAKAPFFVNDLDGVRYLFEIAWHAAGKPDRTGWFLNEHISKDAAVTRASQLAAYTLWGLTPFMREEHQVEKGVPLEPLVLGDPLLQRMLVTIVVRPDRVARANHAGALAFQTFLLEPATQAAMRTIHYSDEHSVTWVPGGRHNRTAVLPKA
jgi:tungstate transport system substrate-binding protein